ncbi:MAG: esterase family protein [Planctomycetes bacterium]|nr:esterase family protein [Planctomycetota bacterium]
MNGALRELESKHVLHAADIDAFLRSRKFPIVEGRTVTFVFVGAAEEVRLRHWISGLPTSQKFQRFHDSPLWTLSIDIPEGSRVEYKLELVRGGHHQLIQDPLNENLARDPYGANSVVYGAGYAQPDWAQHDHEARLGEIQEQSLSSSAFGDTRSVLVYLPARFRTSRRYPLLIAHDGPDYLKFASLRTVLDNLIHRLEVQPMIVALIQSNNRLIEYADDERHARFLVDELLPMMEARYPLVPQPAARCLMGASFGGVASLAAAWRRPGVFGNLMLQSGSFVFTDIGHHDRGPVFDPVVRFMSDFRARPGRPADNVYLSCGIYEGLIYYNRSIVPLLQSTGMQVKFTEARDGHNWENWRDRLREGLSWLAPGQLWMVYE